MKKKSTLGAGYGLKEEDIRAMSKKDLQEAVIRMFACECKKFAEDSWHGSFLLPDDLADAFRGRQ